MHLQDKKVVETFEQYKPLFLRYRDKQNDIDDEMQESFLLFAKFLEKKSIDDKWFAYELKNHIMSYKNQEKKKNTRQRHISFDDIKIDYDIESHYKTVEYLYEEKVINELYVKFKGNLSEVKVKVLDLLELHGIHTVKQFMKETGYSHTYFHKLKDQLHSEFRQYLKANGYNI